MCNFNKKERDFWLDVLNSNLEDLEILKGVINFYVLKNYTLMDIEDSLILRFNFSENDTEIIMNRIKEVLTTLSK